MIPRFLLACTFLLSVRSFTVTPFANKIPSSHSFINRKSDFQLSLSYDNNEDDGPSSGVVLAGIASIIIFLGGSIVPGVIELTSAPTVQGSGLGNAVAPMGSSLSPSSGSAANANDARFEKLSRAQIQEKLNRVPVFYVANNDDSSIAGEHIYFSYEDATSAAGSDDQKVKVTTLDQVMYPLVLKRGRMRMAPAPVEVSNAEAKLGENSSSDDVSFGLIPSQHALQAASELGFTLQKGDVPLFAADRLAFASNSGPEVPLFLEKGDCISSYKRLRGASSSSKLPEEATIRVTTLNDQLRSMERGSLPAMRQIQFFGTEYDLLQASQLF